MALWVSKEALGPQESSPLSHINYINILMGKNEKSTDLYFPLYFLEFNSRDNYEGDFKIMDYEDDLKIFRICSQYFF